MTSSPDHSPFTKEWLSLPGDFNVHESFADDLIRQFGLHEDIQLDQKNEELTVPSPPPRSPTTSNPAHESSRQSDTATPLRRSSAENILRRSSAFLKSTLWKSRSHETQQQQLPDLDLPATVFISTTITLPFNRNPPSSYQPSILPPIISTYPPKPLQYSPVAVVVDPLRVHQKTLMHRLSMPVLRHCASNFGISTTTSTTASDAAPRRQSYQSPLPPHC